MAMADEMVPRFPAAQMPSCQGCADKDFPAKVIHMPAATGRGGPTNRSGLDPTTFDHEYASRDPRLDMKRAVACDMEYPNGSATLPLASHTTEQIRGAMIFSKSAKMLPRPTRTRACLAHGK